jgi:hypothetical protein
MSATETMEQDPCLCQGKVPEDKRIDFQTLRPDPKTGKPKLKTVLRYHKDCPEHGLKEL